MTTDPLFIDLETRSAEDLRRAGGRRYAEHPSTKLLTAAWIHHDERHVWIPTDARALDGFLRLHLPNVHVHRGHDVPDCLDTTVPWVAHNAWEFDELVWRKLFPHHQPDTWIDTANLAKQNGWPGALDRIGKLIRGEGKQKTKKQWFNANKKEPGVGDLVLIAKYNLDDVEIMEQFYRMLPPDQEPDVLWAHRRINDRGVRVDTKLLERLRDLCVYATESAVDECSRLSHGAFMTLESLRKRDVVQAWLEERCAVIIKDGKFSLDKKAIEAWIDEEGEENPEVPVEVIPFLRARMAALRITAGKLDAALSSIANGRIDGVLSYCGGGTTWRWSSRRIQIHNMARPKKGLNTWGLLDVILSDNDSPFRDQIAHCTAPGATVTPADAVSSLLRFVFLPDDGKLLAACDYSQVECRELNRLAGEEWVLNAFRAGKSPYDAGCVKLFGEPPTGKDDPRRNIAKVTELACGYGMGVDTFTTYCEMELVDLAAVGTTAAACVYGYRRAHPKVTDFWDMLDYAAKKCVRTGDRQQVGKQIEFRYDGGNLYLVKPSGKRLTFRRAKIDQGKYGEQVVYWNHSGYYDWLSGGKLAGIVTQGSMRDLMAEATVRLEKAGFKILFGVHDELVTSVRDRAEAVEFARLMVQLPEWCKDLPLEAECDIMERYAKSARSKQDSFTVRGV